MANQIIILNKVQPRVFSVAFWIPIPGPRQSYYANPNATSAWKDINATELASLRNGEFVEVVQPVDVTGLTVPLIKAMLIDLYSRASTELLDFNPFSNYGTRFDGSSWINGGA